MCLNLHTRHFHFHFYSQQHSTLAVTLVSDQNKSNLEGGGGKRGVEDYFTDRENTKKKSRKTKMTVNGDLLTITTNDY